MPNYTQRAGQYIGQMDDEQQQTKKTPTGIHLLDSNERIIDVLTNQSDKIYWDTKITEDQQDNLLTLDFTTLGTIDFTNVRLITAQDQDGNHRLFVLSDIEKVHDENGLVQIVHADGEHISLAQDQPIAPTTLSGATAETAAQFVLTNSRYKLGQVDFLGSREVKFTDFLSPLAALNKIASDFDAILRFRVEIVGNTIERYVDILEPIDIFSGKEFVFGKDIVGLKRKENRADIVTRLVGYGPADEDGNFVTFESINDGKNYVEDADAFQRWNDGGRHRYGIFQYQPEDTTDVTPQKVLDATKDALKRQNDAAVEYELTGAALEQIVGYEHEKVRVGMTIRIKDTYFEPALYLEAEVLRTEMPEYGDPNGEFAYTFGNYREVDISIPDDIKRIQSVLMKQQTRWTVAKDIADDAKQTAETAQQTADSKNKSSYGPNPPSNPKTGDIWFVTDGSDVVIAIRHWDGTKWVDDIDNVAVQQAIDEANQAATNAQQVGQQAQQTAEQATQTAQAAQAAADEATQAANNAQADADDAKTQAQSAVDTANQASTDATNAINQAQSAFDNAQNALTATDSLANRMTDAEGNISALQQTSDSFATRITNAEGDISTLTQTVDGLQTTVSDVQGDVSSVTQLASALQVRMTNAEGDINTLTATANSLTSSITAVQTDLNNLQIGGRNLALGTATPKTKNTFAGTSNETYRLYDVNYSELRGRPYISFDLEMENLTTNDATKVRIVIQLYSKDANEQRIFENIWSSTSLESRKEHISIPINRDYLEEYQEAYIQLRTDYITSGKITVSKLKIETGNRATDWTPAPEDMATQSQISQLSNDINLRVSKNDVINQINLSTEGILIDGSKVHITGQTTIDNAVIKDAMIASLSASKLTAGTIDASVITVKNINASNIITGTLDASKVTVTNIDASKINTGTLNAARIAAGSIDASKLNVSTLSAISANLGNITAGHIKGVTIEGSTISATGGTNTVELTQYGLEVKSKGGNGTYISPGEGIGFGDYFDGKPRSSIYSSHDNTVTIQGKHLEVVSSVGNVLQLVGFGGASYIEFYRDAGTSRSGYFGVPSPSSVDMGWTNQNGDINITPLTNVNVNGHLTIEGQTFRIITDSSFGYIQTSRSEIRATKYGSGTLIPLRASSFPTGSLEEYKQDIQLWEDSAIDIIKNADLYQYRLKSEVEAGIDKIRHGFIIGEGYRTPEMLIDGDGVEQYAMNALSIKAIQELIVRVENLERMMNA